MTVGLNQSDLQLMVKTQAAFELVAVSHVEGTKTVWTLDVVLGNGDRAMVTTARRKGERKVWKQLSALHRFVHSTIPEVERFTVLTAPVDRKGTNNAKNDSGDVA